VGNKLPDCPRNLRPDVNVCHLEEGKALGRGDAVQGEIRRHGGIEPAPEGLRPPTRGDGDENDLAFLPQGQVVAPVRAGGNDRHPVAHGHARDALLPQVTDPVSVLIVEDHAHRDPATVIPQSNGRQPRAEKKQNDSQTPLLHRKRTSAEIIGPFAENHLLPGANLSRYHDPQGGRSMAESNNTLDISTLESWL